VGAAGAAGGDRLRALVAHGWGRAALVALALALALLISGAMAAIYYRPYGHDVRALLGRGWPGVRTTAAAALHVAHLTAAIALGLAVIAIVLLARRGRDPGAPGRGRLALVVTLAAAFAGTGLVVPWDRLLPWSPVLGGNMARPMPLGQQGPFAELVGVNVRYDEAMLTLARRRWGVKATGRLYYAHVVGLPLLAGLAALPLVRRRRG
jgi:ABC-type Fe3+ transport system permease subunit